MVVLVTDFLGDRRGDNIESLDTDFLGDLLGDNSLGCFFCDLSDNCCLCLVDLILLGKTTLGDEHELYVSAVT